MVWGTRKKSIRPLANTVGGNTTTGIIPPNFRLPACRIKTILALIHTSFNNFLFYNALAYLLGSRGGLFHPPEFLIFRFHSSSVAAETTVVASSGRRVLASSASSFQSLRTVVPVLGIARIGTPFLR
jgi:hypothetical protein